MNKAILLVPALALGLVTPVLAQQIPPNTGSVNMGRPIQLGQGADILRRPGGGGGRGFQAGGSGRGGFQGGGGPGRGFAGGPRGGYYGGRGDYGRHRDRGYGYGVGAGLAGLAAGAVIGGAIASQGTPAYGYGYDYAEPVYAPPPPPADDEYVDTVTTAGGDPAYCAQRYRSYDPGSGTYLGYDGLRHPCP